MKKKHNPEKGEQEAKAAEAENATTNRNVYVFGRLENEVALPVIRRMLKLNERDKKAPINMYINSSGGNGYNADCIIALMHSIEAPVNTICLGHALSGACEILASGTGERSAYEFATLMFHQTLWEAEGDITNLEIQAVQGRRFREAQIEVLHRCTAQPKDKLRKDIERDFYVSAREALEYNLIDSLIEHKGTTAGNKNRAGKKPESAKVKSVKAAAQKPHAKK